MSNQLQVLDWAIRNDADAWTVQYFAGRYDPYWRAVFIESLLRLMRDRPAVGAGAADASGMDAFAGEQYVHGNVARGLVAAGVNELAMHCEDLFSVVRAVHADRGFALGVVNYSAGKTTGLARRIADAPDEWVRRGLLVPDVATVAAGLAGAEDPARAVSNAEAGAARIVGWCRDAAHWYRRHEASHLRYKHGLRLLLGGFGPLTKEQIDGRRASTSAALLSLTNEPVRDGAAVVMFEFSDRLRPHLSALFERRLLLRVESAGGDTDLVEVAELAWKVAAVQACVLANRLAIDESHGLGGEHVFRLPHPETRLSVAVALHTDRMPSIGEFRLRL